MSKRIDSTPRQDGFRMPGEHEPQAAVWMAWPERTDNWRFGGKPAQTTFVNVAEAISQSTPVNMVVSAQQFENARQMLPDNVRLVEMSTDDSWMRDIGPSYVIDSEGHRRGVDWHFNAWGGLVDGLYFPWDKDDAVAQKVCEFHGDASYRAPIVLEGGSIHVDGEGTLYTTEECLLHPSRNPDLSKEEIEQVLYDYLSVEKVIWIPSGLYNDETNGHVDNLIHVVRPGEIVLTWCDDKTDPQYEISRHALDVLETQTDAKGRKIRVHKLPMPGPLFISENEANGVDVSEGMERTPGERLAGSYANYLVTNDQIVYPLLDDNLDSEVEDLLNNLYPGYKITGVDAREILLGGGNIHCITQQVPCI
ncbi:agmatine deiminase [Photobacterium lutimaris]|uniref:Putative agmatine deiminase n=1 Tax=Photobacterium lutimaris TaxID=388278 RepID=A0A2T3IZ07_9GAMM|nr:agmatine deiminase [Photobacterium lutimaris]PSU33874.1 agmatine deiminase [Photobacterium lutimaris]TDR76198.1 agmatine deiminase [Photobacterium lutimaris]